MTDQSVVKLESTGVPIGDVGMRDGSNGTSIAPQNLGEVVKFAQVMSRAGIALPEHLRGQDGACMAVAMQALEWKMNPFAVASKSYQVRGVIAYEAQLIAAVVNTRSGIKGRLKYEYSGDGPDLVCTVTGTLDGDECVYQSPKFSKITTKNSPLWKSDPEQQLGYYSARAWARRHCPEVILGVYDREEASEFKDVTPQAGTGLADRLSESSTGFDPKHVAIETNEAVEASEAAGENAEKQQANVASDEADLSPSPTEITRDAASAARDGLERTPPENLVGPEIGTWFDAYDAALEGGER